MLGHPLPHFNWAAVPTVANPTSIWYEGLTPQHPAAVSHQHPCRLPRSGLRLGSVPARLPSSAVSTATLCPRFRGIPSCSAPSPLPTHLYPAPPSVCTFSSFWSPGKSFFPHTFHNLLRPKWGQAPRISAFVWSCVHVIFISVLRHNL